MSEYDSAEYYEGNDQAGDRPALKFYARLFKHHMGKTTKKKPVVLEYGCGVGHLTKRLVNDYDVFSLDISSYALKQVNKNAPEAKTIKTINKIKDGTLDGVVALHVMEHIKKPEIVFNEFYQKLKPGGLLMFVVPNPDGFGHKLKKDDWFGFSDKTHISLFGVNEWLKLTKGGGFRITKYTGDGMWDVPYLPILPTFLQKLIFLPPAALQVVAGRSFLPTILGECLIVVAYKEKNPKKRKYN